MKKNELSLTVLRDALKTLREAVDKKKPTQLERDGVVQRFEYTFELAWKTVRRYLELNDNPKLSNLKDIFREAGRQGLIDSVEDWFGFLEARNLTSHTYKKETADRAYDAATQFCPAAEALLKRLEKSVG